MSAATGPKRTLRPCRKGGALLAFVLTMPLLFAILTLGVDAVSCIVAKSVQGDALQTALDAQKSPLASLTAKNSEDPGRTMATVTVEALRAKGYDGRIDVWFDEGEQGIGPQGESTRRFTVTTELADSVETSFATLFGAQSVRIASSETFEAMPYSEFETWRPDSIPCGRYRCEEGASASRLDFEPLPMPER